MSNLTDWMGRCHELEEKLAAAEAKASAAATMGLKIIKKKDEEIAALTNANIEATRGWSVAETEIIRLKEWNQERAGQFACTEQRLATQIAELEKERGSLRNTLAFCEGGFSIIEISPDEFNIAGVKEARRRIQECLSEPPAVSRP